MYGDSGGAHIWGVPEMGFRVRSGPDPGGGAPGPGISATLAHGAEADPSDSFEPGALLRFIAPIIGVAKHCVKMTHVFAGVGAGPFF